MKTSMKKIWVVKVGGELLNNSAHRKKLLDELARLSRKQSVILVHGGGPQIAESLIKERIPVRFVGGRRLTSPEAMAVVEKVLSGLINKGLVADLVKKKVPAVGLSGRDGGMVVGKLIPGLGRAAGVRKVNARLLLSLVKSGFLPVVSSVGSDREGHAVNIDADDFAGGVALALKASHLVFLTDVEGVKNGAGRRIPVLKTSHVPLLIRSGVIHGGMVPKVQSAVLAIRRGVREVDILKGGKGIRFSSGTRIVR